MSFSGFALDELGRLADSLVAYEKAISLNPLDSISHNNKGNK